jgi:xanthine dehydrogenase large subunit
MMTATDASPLMASPVGISIPHDSASKHVSGSAIYIDDMPEPPGLLHAYLALSSHAHARIRSIDLTAVLATPGVAAVMTARDVPGVNDVGPAVMGDPIFADGLVEYHGQSIFAVAATSMALARQAASKAVIEYEILPPILTIDEAMAAQSFVMPTQVMQRGDADAALARAPLRLAGRIDVGGQEHFYLEGQVAMAIPGEDGDMLAYSSTQHPTEVQHLVARALKLSDHAVVCETRRMGGGFGGKESQASLIAVAAALLAQRTGRPVKLRLDRDDDMILTGKRPHARIDYDVGFDQDGCIQGIRFIHAIGCGYSPDLSAAIADRAMFHADNAYYLDHVHIVSYRCKTNTVSNTAFRGFGGPQGMVGIEHVVDEIARSLRIDPLTVRKRNFYGTHDRNITPYHMTVEDNVIAELEHDADYATRRQAVAAFNAVSPWIKRGVALTPVKFGISFTLTHMNQAGALVHVYTEWQRATEPRRHRDGAGAVSEDRPDRCRRVRHRAGPGENHRDHDGEGAEYVADRRLVRDRSEWQSRSGGHPRDQGAYGGGRGRRTGCAGVRRRLRRRPGRRWRQGHGVRRNRQAGAPLARAVVIHRILQHAEDPL